MHAAVDTISSPEQEIISNSSSVKDSKVEDDDEEEDTVERFTETEEIETVENFVIQYESRLYLIIPICISTAQEDDIIHSKMMTMIEYKSPEMQKFYFILYAGVQEE